MDPEFLVNIVRETSTGRRLLKVCPSPHDTVAIGGQSLTTHPPRAVSFLRPSGESVATLMTTMFLHQMRAWCLTFKLDQPLSLADENTPHTLVIDGEETPDIFLRRLLPEAGERVIVTDPSGGTVNQGVITPFGCFTPLDTGVSTVKAIKSTGGETSGTVHNDPSGTWTASMSLGPGTYHIEATGTVSPPVSGGDFDVV